MMKAERETEGEYVGSKFDGETEDEYCRQDVPLSTDYVRILLSEN